MRRILKYGLVGSLLLAVGFLAGCGQRNPGEQITVEETPAPSPTPTPEATITPLGELVEMQAVSPENSISNIVGDKARSNASLTVTNQTGDPWRSFYIRLHPEDDDEEEWGEDLIDGAFTLANLDKMLVYYNGQGGNPQSTLYDLRVVYTLEDRHECYFRNIPLETVSKITLLMDGVGEDSLPYAVYTTTGNKEYSTLNEVKKRLGLLDDDEDEEDEDEDYYTYETPDNTSNTVSQESISETANVQEAAEDPTPTPVPVPEEEEEVYDVEEEIDTGEINGNSFEITDTMSTAAAYIGSSIEALEAAIGDANGHDYENEPESGYTGYYYYGSFTVSTTVADDGSEIVTGVW